MQALKLPLYLLRNDKAGLKRHIAEHVTIDPRGLPYREELVAWLRGERARGRRIVLATASDARYAEAVAAHLDLFDDVLASDGHTNLKGTVKLQAILDHAHCADLSYAGNDTVDLAIWARAQGAVVVSSSARLARRAGQLTTVEKSFRPPTVGLRDLLYGIRLHQWLKNLLVFLPVLPILSQATPGMLAELLAAFMAFGLAASSTYVVNDLLDLESDRQHHRKRNRPFASGRIGVPGALALAGALLVSAALFAKWLAPAFWVVLVSYVGLTLLYSLMLKRRVLVDVFALAALYTLRILGGAAAIQVLPSLWILAFSAFTFLSLALVKRYVELAEKSSAEGLVNSARGYLVSDLGFVQGVGIASGQVSALVLSLYVNDPLMAKRYAHPYVLWLIVPLYLYWISRMWLKAFRVELHCDPVVFAARNRISRLVFLLCSLALLAAV